MQNNRLFLLLIILITALCYLKSLDNDFVNIDDNKLITENPIVIGKHIRFIDIIKYQLFQAHYKPLVVLSWRLEYKLFGANAFFFHVNNLILHIINCLLVFYILKKILQRSTIEQDSVSLLAFFAVLLFGIHPLHVESVAWATERKDVLYTFFFFGAMLAYTSYLEQKKTYYFLLAIVSYFLSVASKSPGITLIAVLFLLDYIYEKRIFIATLRQKIPFLLILLLALYAYGLLTNFSGQAAGLTQGIITKAGSDEAANLLGLPSMYSRLLLLNYKFLFWAIRVLVPYKLSIIYPRNQLIEIVGQAIHILPLITLAIFYAAYTYRKQYPWLLYGLVFYTINIAPSLSIYDKGTGIFLSDRYVYVASLGIMIIVMPCIAAKTKSIHRQYIIFSLLSIICFVSGYKRTQVWKNSETLFLDVIKKYPKDTPIAYNNLGLYYAEKNEPEKAISHFNVVIEQGYSYYQAYNNLANLYFRQGQYEKAIPYYSRALIFKPQAAELYSNRGASYYMLQQIDSALKDLNKAIEIHPFFVDALKNRALIYMHTGQTDKALIDFARILNIIPHEHEVINAKGMAYYKKGQYDDAIAEYSKAITLYNKASHYYINRAYAYYIKKEYRASLEDVLMAEKLGFKADSALISFLKNKLTEKQP